jgi:Outer membrane protein beta-barrel domain
MKKYFLFAVALTSINTYAQKSQLGFTGGTTIANYKMKSDGNDESLNSKFGFTLGVIGNVPFGRNWSIQPGINWVQKGTKDEETIAGVTEKVALITNHIEVPVNFIYTGKGFFIGAGPSFAFGVSGKIKVDDGTTKADEKVKFGNSDNDDIKPFDFGANAVAGYQFSSGFFIAANYNFGLSNLIPGDAQNSSVKSRYAGIKLGYFLKGKG